MKCNHCQQEVEPIKKFPLLFLLLALLLSPFSYGVTLLLFLLYFFFLKKPDACPLCKNKITIETEQPESVA